MGKKLCILFLCVWSFISLSLAGSGSSEKSHKCRSTGRKDERTYVFAFTEIGVVGPFADGPNPNGTSVNIILEVCKRCHKNCEAAMVSFGDFFNGECSRVLDERWYDALSTRVDPEMLLGYSSSDLSLRTLSDRIIISKPENNYTLADLQNPLNNFTFAYIDSGNFLNCYLSNGYFLNDSFAVSGQSIEEQVNNVGQIILNGEADIGLVSSDFFTLPDTFDTLAVADCSTTVASGIGIIARKDDEALLDWFNKCFKEFVCSGDYQDFCDAQEELFDINISCLQPEQAGC